MTTPDVIEFEYRHRKVIARPVELGWELEVASKNGGVRIGKLTTRDLSEMIDEAKRVIDVDLDG
jgi:hypothetical protein